MLPFGFIYWASFYKHAWLSIIICKEVCISIPTIQLHRLFSHEKKHKKKY